MREMLTGAIIKAVEEFANPALQEEWDNTGIQVGSRNVGCKGVLLCVDVTPAIVDEAIARGCNLIISHHPLIFKGLKRLTGATPVETSVMNAIAAGITIYSCHTAVDNAPGGVSYAMAKRLGIKPLHVLEPLHGRMIKLSVIVPRGHADAVRLSLFDAGAGSLGNYDCCSFNTDGYGTFKALDGADPFVGTIGEIHQENEVRIDMLVPSWKRLDVEAALREAHPYEEPAYEFQPLLNVDHRVGSGVFGMLDAPVSASELIGLVKSAFGSPVVRTTALPRIEAGFSKIAMCGGAGGAFIKEAIASGAQAYISSDTRYHDFVDYQNDILLIDIGHFESESCTKDIFYHVITEKFPNFATYYSELEKNPINYL